MSEGLHVILRGDPQNGFDVFGPFKTGDDAFTFLRKIDRIDAGDTWVMQLRAAAELKEEWQDADEE